jgi:hypothetical protein
MKLYEVLEPMGYPVDRFRRVSSSLPSISYFYVHQGTALAADNEEQKTKHIVQVDVWASRNINSVVKEVKAAMKAAGYWRIFEYPDYEEDTKLLHTALRFSIYTEPEEEL